LGCQSWPMDLSGCWPQPDRHCNPGFSWLFLIVSNKSSLQVALGHVYTHSSGHPNLRFSCAAVLAGAAGHSCPLWRFAGAFLPLPGLPARASARRVGAHQSRGPKGGRGGKNGGAFFMIGGVHGCLAVADVMLEEPPSGGGDSVSSGRRSIG